MSSPTAPSARILVVEDLDHNRQLFMTVLARAGYEVETAPNGQEAVAALEAKVFDLVLMDVQMPVMDGLSATRKIRELGAPACDVPIVGMSANVLPEQLNAFQAAGMDDHLGKPFRRAQLLDKVAAWLGRSRISCDPSGAAPRDGVVADPAPDAVDVSADLDEIFSLMGRDWMLASLSELIRRIDETFPDDETLDPGLLARRAHALVSQSALLGFRGLADASSALEIACDRDRDLLSAYQRARGLALAVRREAERLRGTSGDIIGRPAVRDTSP